MLRPIPFPMQVESVVLGAALVVMGLFLVIRGSLPRWLPSGYVDQAGNRAELSRPVYRLVGVTGVLVGVATPLIAVSQPEPTPRLAFALIAVVLLCAIPTAVMASGEQSRRSLRRNRSTQVWTALAILFFMAINWYVFYGSRA